MTASSAAKPAKSRGEPRGEGESARDVIQALVKTIKGHKMYLPEHAIRRRFQDEFAARMREHGEAFGDLVLTVKPYELWCGGGSVYEEPNRLENLAFRAFADGLRELTVHVSVTAPELERLVAVLATDLHPLNDDLVTRLWEQGFGGISYQVAEAGDQDGKEPVLSGPPVPRESESDSPQAASEAAGVPMESNPEDQVELDDRVYRLDEHELATLQHEVEEDARRDHVEQLIDILTSMLTLDDDEDTFTDVLSILDEFVTLSLRARAFHRAASILARLNAVLEPTTSLSGSHRDRVRQVAASLGSWERVKPLLALLNESGPWQAPDLSMYLRLLPSSAIGSLITLLEEIQTAKGRRLVCDVIVATGRSEIQTVIDRLPSAPWYLARNLVYVLGCWKDPAALPALQGMITNQEIRIRQEVLKAIENIGGPDAGRLIMMFLDDREEAVRLLAMRALRSHPTARAIERITGLIADRGFAHRSPDEQHELFETVAVLGGEALLPWIQQLIRRPRFALWRGREAYATRVRGAVTALRRIGTPAAKALLNAMGASGKGVPRDRGSRPAGEGTGAP